MMNELCTNCCRVVIFTQFNTTPRIPQLSIFPVCHGQLNILYQSINTFYLLIYYPLSLIFSCCFQQYLLDFYLYIWTSHWFHIYKAFIEASGHILFNESLIVTNQKMWIICFIITVQHFLYKFAHHDPLYMLSVAFNS